MEGFTQILNQKAKDLSFSFHPKLQLSSFILADDLFILSKDNVPSILKVKEALSEFQASSGLKPNLRKCEIVSTGIPHKEKLTLSSILGMPLDTLLLDTLLIKYLGLPLLAGKLSKSH